MTAVVNLKANRDWRPNALPEGVAYMGKRLKRGGWDLPQSDWANPCRREAAPVRAYIAYLRTRPDLVERVGELRGLTLACWCAPRPCHCDVLAALADGAPFAFIAGVADTLTAAVEARP